MYADISLEQFILCFLVKCLMLDILREVAEINRFPCPCQAHESTAVQ